MSDLVSELKAKHGDVYTLTVKNKNNEVITVYLKEMDRAVYKSVSALFQKDELTGIESFLKSLWIGGDDVNKITSDFKALRNCTNSVLEIMKIEDSELKKN